ARPKEIKTAIEANKLSARFIAKGLAWTPEAARFFENAAIISLGVFECPSRQGLHLFASA
ncbi:MAG: hypothetical protein WBF01_05610, partial [Candidatus Acidiferrum sp.]